MRVKRNLTRCLLEVYPDGSALVEIGSGKATRLVREILGRVQRGGRGLATTVRLWTSLLDWRRCPAAQLLALYGRRWEQEVFQGVESGYAFDPVFAEPHALDGHARDRRANPGLCGVGGLGAGAALLPRATAGGRCVSKRPSSLVNVLRNGAAKSAETSCCWRKKLTSLISVLSKNALLCKATGNKRWRSGAARACSQSSFA